MSVGETTSASVGHVSEESYDGFPTALPSGLCSLLRYLVRATVVFWQRTSELFPHTSRQLQGGTFTSSHVFKNQY